MPAALSPNTPGFVARSTGIIDNQYVFDSSVTLQGQTQYWFYTDTAGDVRTVIAINGNNVDTYAGGQGYSCGQGPFIYFIGGDFNFELQGRVAR